VTDAGVDRGVDLCHAEHFPAESGSQTSGPIAEIAHI
jgi:hypothetical protein